MVLQSIGILEEYHLQTEEDERILQRVSLQVYYCVTLSDFEWQTDIPPPSTGQHLSYGVWRVKVVRSVACCVVYDRCAQCYAQTADLTNVCLVSDLFCDLY